MSVMDANECLANGAELLVDEDFAGAIESFTLALEMDSSLVKAYTGRSAAYFKEKKHTEALQDATQAISLDPKCEIAYFRKGVACFELEEYESALSAFKKGKEVLDSLGKKESNARSYSRWMRKCEAEIEDEDDEDITPMEDEEPAPAPAAPVVPQAPSLKYQYYQSSAFVVISVMEKKLKSSELEVDIQDRSVKVTVSREGQEQRSLTIFLWDSVIPSLSKFEVLSTKVEIKLKKVNEFQWDGLENGSGPKITAAAEPVSTSAAPTPYASKKDWNQLDKVMGEELEKEKPEGEAALNELFKSVYANASEETRRAMNKSFQTSGGTVLSTNWDEVAKSDYETERQAPKGMVWKNWEGEKLPQKDDD